MRAGTPSISMQLSRVKAKLKTVMMRRLSLQKAALEQQALLTLTAMAQLLLLHGLNLR